MIKNRKRALIILAVLILIICLAILFALGSRNEDVHQYVTLKVVEVNKHEGKFILENKSKRNVSYDREIELYKKNFGGTWKRVEFLPDTGSFLDVLQLKAGESTEINVSWDTFFGELNSGTYKLVKQIEQKEASVIFKLD